MPAWSPNIRHDQQNHVVAAQLISARQRQNHARGAHAITSLTWPADHASTCQVTRQFQSRLVVTSNEPQLPTNHDITFEVFMSYHNCCLTVLDSPIITLEDTDSLMMALPKLPPTIMLPCRRRLTRTQIRVGNKRRTSSHTTTHNSRSLMDLPRELRDEILRLAVQDDVDPTRDTDLVSRPGPTIRALTHVSRSVRVEAADIYWSRTKFHYSAHDLVRVKAAVTDWSGTKSHYSTHDLVRNSTHETQHCGRYKLTSWLNTWGRLAVPHIQRLKLNLSFDSGGLDIQLSKHASPSINVWTHDGSGVEEYLKIIVTAELFPDGYSTMTPGRLRKVCGILCEVGRMIPAPPLYGKLFFGGLAWHTNDETLREMYMTRMRA